MQVRVFGLIWCITGFALSVTLVLVPERFCRNAMVQTRERRILTLRIVGLLLVPFWLILSVVYFLDHTDAGAPGGFCAEEESGYI
jgi:hypothetical protein